MIKRQLKLDTNSISCRIQCKECDEEFETGSIQIPTPEINDEKIKEYPESHYCPICNLGFEIKILYSSAGIEVCVDKEEIIEINENDSLSDRIADEYEEYWQISAILEGQNHFDTFRLGINYIDLLSELKNHANQGLKRIILMNCYLGLVTQLETYLMNTLVTNVLNEEAYFKNFIEAFEDFKKHKFSISEIYIKQNELDSIVKKKLSGLIYHNLYKIKPIYKAVFKIKFPEISELIKIINIRHDIVHRSGKCKNGSFIKIDEEIFNDAKLKINDFVETIEEKMQVEIFLSKMSRRSTETTNSSSKPRSSDSSTSYDINELEEDLPF